MRITNCRSVLASLAGIAIFLTIASAGSVVSLENEMLQYRVQVTRFGFNSDHGAILDESQMGTHQVAVFGDALAVFSERKRTGSLESESGLARSVQFTETSADFFEFGEYLGHLLDDTFFLASGPSGLPPHHIFPLEFTNGVAIRRAPDGSSSITTREESDAQLVQSGYTMSTTSETPRIVELVSPITQDDAGTYSYVIERTFGGDSGDQLVQVRGFYRFTSPVAGEIPMMSMEALRWSDGIPGVIIHRQYTNKHLDPSMSTAIEDIITFAIDGKTLLQEAEYVFHSRRRTTEEDRLTISQWQDAVQYVRLDNSELPKPVWESVPATNGFERALVYDAPSRSWIPAGEPVAPAE